MRLSKSEIEYHFYILDSGPVRLEVLWILIAWGVISYIQYLLVSVLHAILAIVLSVGMAVLASILHQGLKNMGGNGVNHRAAYSLKVFVLSLIVLSANVAGVYQLVLLLKNAPWNGYLLYGWLLLFAGSPVAYSVWRYAGCYRRLKRHSERYILLRLNIKHYHKLPVHIDKIEFVNTETGAREVYTDIQHNYSAYCWEQQQTDSLMTRVRNSINDLSFESLYIPVNANKFYMSWYSFAEDKYYSDEFPFKYERFEPKQSRFPYGRTDIPVRGISTYELNSIDLYIKSKGRADLYVSGWLLFFFWDVAEVSIEAEKRQILRQKIKNGCEYRGTMEEFQRIMERIGSSGDLDKRYDQQGEMFLWSLAMEGLGELKHQVTIEDTEHKQHYRSVANLLNPESMCLPEKLTFFKREDDTLYFYYYIYIDRDALYDCVKRLTGKHDDVSVHFHLHVHNRMRKQMIFQIQAGGNVVNFDAWQADTTGA